MDRAIKRDFERGHYYPLLGGYHAFILSTPSLSASRWQDIMKFTQRGLKTGLKITSKSGIFIFTIFGVIVYLLTFLGIALTTTEVMATWKLLVGSIGGAIFSGMLIIAVLRFSRYVIIKLSDLNSDIQ